MSDRPKVLIINQNHPHSDEVGYFTGETISVLGTPMAKIELIACPHGLDACYVKAGDIKELNYGQTGQTKKFKGILPK